MTPAAPDPPPAGGPASLLAPLVGDPAAAVLLVDFDGTLAPIVDDPAAARPLPGTEAALSALARTFAVVAVVSGRPVAFLADRLPGATGVTLAGLYGLERLDGTGRPVTVADAERWRPVVGEVVAGLRTAAPGDAVEPKGLTVTVHWRRHPDRADELRALAHREAARTGLVAHPGRMSVELRPPVAVDKGTVVTELAAGAGAAGYLGDDLGDLPAFAALHRLAQDRGTATVAVAAVDAESPPEVAAAADLTVDGPAGALALLEWMARSAAAGRG